jgi:hypothetical protein
LLHDATQQRLAHPFADVGDLAGLPGDPRHHDVGEALVDVVEGPEHLGAHARARGLRDLGDIAEPCLKPGPCVDALEVLADPTRRFRLQGEEPGLLLLHGQAVVRQDGLRFHIDADERHRDLLIAREPVLLLEDAGVLDADIAQPLRVAEIGVRDGPPATGKCAHVTDPTTLGERGVLDARLGGGFASGEQPTEVREFPFRHAREVGG